MALRTPQSSRRPASNKSSAAVSQTKTSATKASERKSTPVKTHAVQPKKPFVSKAKSVAQKIMEMKKRAGATPLAAPKKGHAAPASINFAKQAAPQATRARHAQPAKAHVKPSGKIAAPSALKNKVIEGRSATHDRKPVGECSRYLTDLIAALDHYEQLIGSLSPAAKIPQEPAWFLQNTELEELQPVLDSLEAVIRAPTLNRTVAHGFTDVLKPLGRLVGAPVQVIPHVSQIQALHILLHLGDHPDLPAELLFPLTEALHHVAHDEVGTRLGPKAHARTHRLLARFNKGKKEKGSKALAHKHKGN